MPGDDKETLQTQQQFSPYVELAPYTGQGKRVESPADLQTRFMAMVDGIYPQDTVGTLVREGYNPYVIGYDHPRSLNDLPSVKRQIEEIRRGHQGVLKVGLEVDYAQVGYIKDFLPLEKEYNETGKIKGEVPGKKPEEYRRKLTANHSENLALWLLENGVDVVSLESPDVRRWISEDKGHYPEEEDFFGEHEPIERQGLTAVRRDLHGLGVISTQRPDIISAGAAHALKYDLLLRRNGEKSFYFLESPLDWQRTLNMWQEVHARYKSTA